MKSQEVICLLGENAVYFFEIQLTVWINKSPLSSGMKSKPSKKPA
jgi:hypothetical protein